MTDSTTRPPRTDCEHPDGAIRSMAPAFPDEWACTRCGQRFIPQNAGAAAPDAELREAILREDDVWWAETPAYVRDAVLAALAPDPAPAPDPRATVKGRGTYPGGWPIPGPAPDRWGPPDLFPVEEIEPDHFGAAPAPEPAICSECDNPLIDGVCPIHGAPRKTFSGAQGDACRHCRLSRHSHPEPRLLCPEWALRASDGDR